MNLSALTAVVFAFTCMGLLPRLFFRSDGSFNLRWWATAAPFFLIPGYLVLSMFNQSLPYWNWQPATREIVSVILASLSTGLIGMTVGTNRVPLALWHQNNDAPRNIVTFGAYRYIRHPFYTSFLLSAFAAFVLFPDFFTLAGFAYMLVGLNMTAAREEKRLSQSEFGTEYRSYIARTGRFYPKLG